MPAMGSGPPTARVMVVGEAWGETEERTRIPFTGASGQEFDRMLHEAGLLRSECYVTNVVNARPPRNDIEAWIPADKKSITGRMVQRQGKYVDPIVAEGLEILRQEIALVSPQVIIALGSTALWALTGNESIVKWRGSLLEYRPEREVLGAGLSGDRTGNAGPGRGDRPSADSSVVLPLRVVPTYHPAAILRMWEWRKIAVLDLKRAARELVSPAVPPQTEFIIKPGFAKVMEVLSKLTYLVAQGPAWIDLDLETKYGHIACCGLSWSPTEALCIPFICEEDREGYWLAEEEGQIVFALRQLLTHPNCWVRGQNLLYDCQYTYRRWGFIPQVKQDTMISHHVLWAGLPKNLAFQASLYCHWYVQWKPDKESWKEGG